MENKFQFFEEVIILETPYTISERLAGRKAAILGMAMNDFGNWGYAVSIDGVFYVYDLPEETLVSTGHFRKREDYFTGESIKVVMDEETGEGRIIE